MIIFLAIAGIFVYMMIVSIICQYIEKRRILSLIAGLFIFLFLVGTYSYFYNGSELENYEKAMNGQYYIYKPTDTELNKMSQELQQLDIKREEQILKKMKLGMSREDADNSINDIDEYFLITGKYLGHNPPLKVIKQHISDLKSLRTKRVTISLIIAVLIYTGFFYKKIRECF